MSGAASRHATLKKLKAVASFVSLLLTPITAWSEWRVPETVDMVLGTESIGSERQAVLILSAVAGPSLCDRSSDLKVATKFDEKSALIEVLGYDFTPGPINVPCPAAIRYARTKVSLPNTWLKPDTKNRIVLTLGRSKNQYVANRDGFRVELIPETVTNVVTRPLYECLTVPPLPAAAVLWPQDVVRLYVAGSVVSGQEFRSPLRAFAKAHHMTPADEVHKSLQTDCPMELWVRVSRVRSGRLPPRHTGRRIGALPGHAGVEVYLSGPTDLEINGSWFWIGLK